ncbi:RFC small subunit [Ectocarpus siliculosus]|uniref:RFC small subunit n=1 Tax=Ectocarpus siliculosus TaxID=2880 RepID=D8LPK6_ECTSI|nr:RFC small subunit [Ectocarpus siliculosus]|eukprot:CBN80478.1 RFC small subunit [Ectocarpus siliculosus]
MHPEIEDRLTCMSRHGDIPHLLFHGPRGSGKMTLVRHLLEKLYGPGVNRVTAEKRVVETASSKHTIEIDVRVSNYHIEMEPSDAGANDTYVVQHAIKEMANNGSIAAVFKNCDVRHKTIVLRGAGNLSKQAQAGLRRTMEKFTASCRLVLVSAFASRVIEPLRSRCVLIRVPLPSAENLAAAIEIDDETLVSQIVESSGRSISRAMFMAKAGSADKMLWVKYVESICTGVFLEQSPRKLIDVRDSLNELLVAGVPASIILKTLMHGLISHKSLRGEGGVKREIVRWAAVYEHRICVGSKDILHLEAFVASFMDLYKKHTVNQFS